MAGNLGRRNCVDFFSRGMECTVPPRLVDCAPLVPKRRNTANYVQRKVEVSRRSPQRYTGPHMDIHVCGPSLASSHVAMAFHEDQKRSLYSPSLSRRLSGLAKDQCFECSSTVRSDLRYALRTAPFRGCYTLPRIAAFADRSNPPDRPLYYTLTVAAVTDRGCTCATLPTVASRQQ